MVKRKLLLTTTLFWFLAADHVVAADSIRQFQESDFAVKQKVFGIRHPWEKLAPYGEQTTSTGATIGDGIGILRSLKQKRKKDEIVSADLLVQRRKASQLMMLGDSYARANDFNQAIDCYQRAVNLFPDQTVFHFTLACAIWNKYASAVANKHPDSACEDDLNLSIVHYSKAIELNPQFAEAYLGLGKCKERREDKEGAITALKECVRLKPAYGAGWFELGRAYDSASDFDNAENAYQTCLSNEQDPNHIMNLSKFLIKNKHFRTARAYLEKIVLSDKASDGLVKTAKEQIEHLPGDPTP
jgi:tetratricopeptide (TPR) repeat protein